MRIMRGVRAALVTVVPTAVLLLIPTMLLPDGEQLMPRALWFLAAFALVVMIGNIALAVGRPASFEARRQGLVAPEARKQPLIDAVGLVAYVAYIFVWFVFIPLDVAWLHLLPPPPTWAAAAGLVAAIVGNAVSYLAVWQNQFATPTIQDQSDEAQRVIDSGLYGLIRHPLYAGNLLFFAGLALWLGSVAAVLGTAVHLLATVARIVIEEDYLRANLPGYADYARRVRARLIPFVI
jgi:protein-S-isoprenylcysteine O-methyltransferase Ste14